MTAATLLILLCTQQGDKPGEAQPDLPPSIKIPPSPVVPPEKALETFRIVPGFRIELVASEPLVEDPVQIAFDEEGRLWVAEMRGFMPNLERRGERDPVGKIAVLEDTDGDGRMDRRTVFLDGLVLPRAIGLASGGVLVAEPPRLWFCRDTDGDLICDQKEVVDPDYATARGNPEHLPNGLLLAIDNWIYNGESRARYRRIDGEWVRAQTLFRGQWGMTQDDLGRLYYNINYELLRGDRVPVYHPEAHAKESEHTNVLLAGEGPVWPIRVCAGVNRGYRKVTLRPDGTLRIVVSACAPLVYRGDQFPEEFRGDVFICEPAGNLIKRLVLEERDGKVVARDPYEKREFLASTDERFRPSNLCLGPDGCLYVADFYRGIIQHGQYMTSFLRKQILSRALDAPVGLGRIYRIVSTAAPSKKAPPLSKQPAARVRELSHPNGWRRDAAQRVLVARGDLSIVPALRQVATAGTSPRGRLHALFTLEGLGQLDAATIEKAVKDAEISVREAAALLKEGGAVDPIDLLVFAAVKDAALPEDRLAKVAGRELDFIERAMAYPAWEERKEDREALLRRLAAGAIREGNPGRVAALLDLIAVQAQAARWRQKALLEGMNGARPRESLRLPARSASLVKLAYAEDEAVRSEARKTLAWTTWAGKKEREPAPPSAPRLDEEERARFARGRKLFTSSCSVCHQLSGLGEAGKGPPLVDSEWVLGSEQRIIRILLHGLMGPVTVRGKTYPGVEMPALMNMSSEEIAAVLTYIRREWGHQAAPVNPAAVRAIAEKTEDREEPWTAKELLRIP